MSGNTKGLDHVAIAVKDLDAAVKYYVDVLGFPPPEFEVVEDQKVKTAIFGHGMGRIEFISPTDPSSSVAKFLDKRGDGLHHLCVEVSNLEAALVMLKEQGAQLIDQTPRLGAGGAKIAFVHPKGALGVLTELREGPHDPAES